MQMIKLMTAVAALSILAVGTDAQAQPSGVAGSYDVTVSNVANSCKSDAVELAEKTAVAITTDVKDITIKLPNAPDLQGPLRKRGRFKATGVSKSADNTRSGNFSATGRANNGSIRMVLIAEFFKDGKAQCTQSWNIVGKRR